MWKAARTGLGKAKRLGGRIAGREGKPLERFDYSYSADTAMVSAWAAHYVIYAELAGHAAPAVPTMDLCCGTGPGSRYLRDALGAYILSVDYSKSALKYARDNNMSDGV